MKRIALFALICGMALAAAGCVMPKEFTAKIDVKKDGAYDFIYDGTITYLTMLEEEAKAPLTKEAEKAMVDEFIAKAAKDKSASNVSYVGDGVFKLTYHKTGNIGEEMHVPSGWGKDPFFEFVWSRESSQVIFQFLGSEKIAKQLEAIPAKAKDFKGTIELTTELEVAGSKGSPEHKADTKTYTWKVEGIKPDMPGLTMKFEEKDMPPPLDPSATSPEATMQ